MWSHDSDSEWKYVITLPPEHSVTTLGAPCVTVFLMRLIKMNDLRLLRVQQSASDTTGITPLVRGSSESPVGFVTSVRKYRRLRYLSDINLDRWIVTNSCHEILLSVWFVSF
jgi:hypothetical protein